MSRWHTLWTAALLALVLALPTSAALAAQLAPAAPKQAHLWIECQTTTVTTDIQVNNDLNPFWDDLGNEWLVYYDLTRDSHDGTPCSMRVDIRIFNPAPDGSWHGTVNLYADENGTYNSASYGQVSGSGTYQAHFVWRGPWFGANLGASYVLFTNEFNGSTTYSRASTNFSL